MEFINLTPHPVTICGVTLQPAGAPPRCATVTIPQAPVVLAGVEVPVEVIRLGAVSGLPEPRPGVAYIVSRPVAEAAPERRDLYIPHNLVREGGVVTGCAALGQVPGPGKRRVGQSVLLGDEGVLEGQGAVNPVRHVVVEDECAAALEQAGDGVRAALRAGSRIEMGPDWMRPGEPAAPTA